MAKSKKSFSKEAMYKKIMPSINKIEEVLREGEDETITYDGQFVNIDSNIRIVNINSKITTDTFDEYQEVKKGVVELADGSIIDDDCEEDDCNIKDVSEIIDGFNENTIDEIKEVNCLEDLYTRETDNSENDKEEIIGIDVNSDLGLASDYLKIHTKENEIEKDDKAEEHFDLTEKKSVNLVELAFDDKIENVLDKFSCCKCNECRNDIKDLVLKSVPEIGFTGNAKEIKEAYKEYNAYGNLNISSAIVKAIVSIRKKNKH